MPGFELEAFREMPTSDAPIIFYSVSRFYRCVAACIGSGVGILEDLVAQWVCFVFLLISLKIDG